jgi:phosphate transport system substrate-binding protein
MISWNRSLARRTAALVPLAGLLTLGSIAFAQRAPRPAALAFRPQGAQLTGAGSTFVQPLMSKWISRYQGAHAGTRINYQGIGSGAGIQQLKNGTVDFGASDAALSDEEERGMGKPVAQFPVTAGAVVLTYNVSGVPNGLKLTPEAIAGIFIGKITRWNDPAIQGPNPGMRLPARPILVAHRSDGSGTTFIFTHYLSAVNPEWKQRVGASKTVNWPVGQGGKGSPGVTAIVKGTGGSIGYVELAYAYQNHLPIALVRNRSGNFVAPTVQSTSAAVAASAGALRRDIRSVIVDPGGRDAYPIAGLTYVMLNKQNPDGAKGRAVVDFMNWAIHAGQGDSAPLLYAPLPPAIVKADEAVLHTVR